MSGQWIPRWRLRELSRAHGMSSPTQRFAKALVLGDIPADRPSHALSNLVLESMGMPNASFIHGRGEGSSWNGCDQNGCDQKTFLSHAHEEEVILFPRLLEIAKLRNRNDVREAIFNLLEDHAKFMSWFQTAAFPPKDLVQNHGMIEDGLIWEFREELAPELFGAKVSGPVDMFTYVAPSTPAPVEDEPTKFYEAREEKFVDPHFSDCGAAKPRGEGVYELSSEFRGTHGLTGEVGPEYLGNVPNNSADRVAAMRARIDSRAGMYNGTYVTYIDASGDKLGEMLRTVVDAASNPAKAKALGESLGIPISKAEEFQKEILKWIDKPGGEIVSSLLSEVGQQIKTLVRQTVSELVGDVSGAGSSIGAIAGAAPVIGFLVQAFTLTYGQMLKNAEDAKNSTCAALLSDIRTHATRLSDNGMPAPWHIVDLGLNCNSVTNAKDVGFPLTTALAVAERADYYQLGLPLSKKKETRWDGSRYSSFGSGLTPIDQVALKKWWSLALLFWSRPEVGQVMQNMGRDYWGGLLASDEQVMLVAAPIAVSYGLDVDDFARKLWDKSNGWRSRPELFVNWWPGGSGKGACGNFGQSSTMVDNARYIQFAVLARDAFELANEKKYTIEAAGLRPISMSEQVVADETVGKKAAKAKLPFQLVLGTTAAGAIYLTGLPIALALSPFALVLYLQYKDRKKRVS